jgi:hypothetical protein
LTSLGSSLWEDEAQTPVDALDACTFDPPARHARARS